MSLGPRREARRLDRISAVPYWTVTGPDGPYNEDVEPRKLDDGRLRLHSGPTLDAGTWQVFPRKGDKPQMPRGSTPHTPNRPERDNPAGGYGPDNVK